MNTKNFTEAWFGDSAKWQGKQVLSEEELIDFLDNYETLLFVSTVETMNEVKEDFLKKFDHDPAINRVMTTFINEYQIRTNKC